MILLKKRIKETPTIRQKNARVLLVVECNGQTIIDGTSENPGHLFPSACRLCHKYRSSTHRCVHVYVHKPCTHAALLHSSLSFFLMRFVRLRQVLRGRAPSHPVTKVSRLLRTSGFDDSRRFRAKIETPMSYSNLRRFDVCHETP